MLVTLVTGASWAMVSPILIIALPERFGDGARRPSPGHSCPRGLFGRCCPLGWARWPTALAASR